MSSFADTLATMMNVPHETGGMYLWGISIRTWSLVVAFPCVILACIISILSMIRHCSRNRDPKIRRHLLRILFMVPVYSINAVMALLYPWKVEFFTLFRETYEAITIYSLANFLFAFLGGESRLNYLLSLEDAATDEYHLYRLAQNLANKSTITLANSNFTTHEPQTHISTIVDSNEMNNNDNDTIQMNTRSDYAKSYLQQEYEHNKAWYKKLPLIRSFFPPPDFHGKSNSGNYITPPVLSSGEEPTFEQKRNKMGDLKSPLLSASPSSQSSNGSNNTLSFQTRPNIVAIQAIDEDRENFKRFKKKKQLMSALKSKQEEEEETLTSTSLDGLNAPQYSPPVNPTQLSPSLPPVGNSNHGAGGDDDDADEFSLDRQPTNNNTNNNNNNNNHHLINITSNEVQLDIDPNIPNRLVDHDPNNAQVILSAQQKDGHDQQYLQDLHGSSAFLTSSQIQQRIVTLEYHPQLATIERTYPHMFPFSYIFKPVHASRFLFIAKFSILQYVPIQIVCAVLAMVGHMAGIYSPGAWSAGNLYPYLSIILNSSQMAALYGLFWFLHTFENNLKGINAMGKALVIKSCVFATFWQSCAISIYYAVWPWCSEDGSKGRQCAEGEWDSEKQAAGINSFLICLEMLIFAVLHISFFSWREFGRPLMYDSQKPVFRSVIEFFSPRDIVSEVKANINIGNVKQVLFPTQLPLSLQQQQKQPAPSTSPNAIEENKDEEPTTTQDGAVIKINFGEEEDSAAQ